MCNQSLSDYIYVDLLYVDNNNNDNDNMTTQNAHYHNQAKLTKLTRFASLDKLYQRFT